MLSPPPCVCIPKWGSDGGRGRGGGGTLADFLPNPLPGSSTPSGTVRFHIPSKASYVSDIKKYIHLKIISLSCFRKLFLKGIFVIIENAGINVLKLFPWSWKGMDSGTSTSKESIFSLGSFSKHLIVLTLRFLFVSKFSSFKPWNS